MQASFRLLTRHDARVLRSDNVLCPLCRVLKAGPYLQLNSAETLGALKSSHGQLLRPLCIFLFDRRPLGMLKAAANLGLRHARAVLPPASGLHARLVPNQVIQSYERSLAALFAATGFSDKSRAAGRLHQAREGCNGPGLGYEHTTKLACSHRSRR